MPPRVRKRGRRPGENVTRQAILDAAQAQFSENGMDGVSMRGIARDANVDPALVMHFYGTKEELFLAATAWPFDPEAVVDSVVTGPRAQIGRRLIRFFLTIWEQPEGRGPIMAMLRAATTSPIAAAALRDAFEQNVLGPVSERLDYADPRDRRLRMNLCSSQLIGLGVARYILALEPLAALSPDEVEDLVAPTLQRYMAGKLPHLAPVR
jgi:AcrR family transcriptional regulator